MTRVVPLPRRPLPKTSVDRAFLSAALEIVESPASPSVRLTGLTICALFAVALAWAYVGRIDIVATAPGKVVPVSHTKEVQAFDAGTVAKILVDDGALVKEGQPLVLLDPSMARADRDRFKDQAMRADLDIARLSALIAPSPRGVDPFAGVVAPEQAIEESRGQLRADELARDAKLAGADREIAAKRADAVSYEAEIGKIDGAMPLVHERAMIRKESSDRGLTSRIDYLNAEQTEIELVNQRKVMVEKNIAAAADVQAQVADRLRLAADFERDWRSQLQKALRDRAEARSELAKAQHRTGLTSITAPVDGTVEDLRVHTEGGVVQAGQQLLKVVPSQDTVAIEAIVENRDAGFVRVGQPVEIKVDAFPYTHYGLLKGHVVQIAKDAAPDPEVLQSSRSGTEPLSDNPDYIRRSGGLIFVARIAIDDPRLLVDGVKTRVESGMAVTTEIKTGRRSVIDYILSPVIEHTHDAMHER